MNGLSPAASRLAALGLLALVLLLVLFYAVVPLKGYYSGLGADLAQQRERLARYRALLSSEAEIEEASRRISSEIQASELFLQGDKPAIIAANLQQFVNQVIRDGGGQPGSSQEYQARPLGASQAIGLRVSATVDERGLADILYQLENSRPMVFVEGLKVQAGAGPGRQRKGDEKAEQPPAGLTVSLDVVGYLPGAAP